MWLWSFALGCFPSLLTFQNNIISFFFSFTDAHTIFLKAQKQNIVLDSETYSSLIKLLLEKDSLVEAVQVKEL